MKTVGILGGMGPLATVDLFKKIVTLTQAGSDNEHIHIIIDNNTEIPDRTDHIINNGENPENHLIKSALKLEMMGADVLIMPCNTAHFFYDKVVKYISVPFLNMIEETAKEIIGKFPSYKRTGLLATEGTCRAGVYDRVFEKYGIELIKPDSENQKYVTELIYGIKQGRSNMDITGFYKVISWFKEQGVDVLILGCTELPVAFAMYDIRVNYLDPTRILACSAIRFAGAKVIGDKC